MRHIGWTAVAMVIGLAGCGSGGTGEQAASPTETAAAVVPSDEPSSALSAVANVQTAQGSTIGTATATSGPGTILVSLRVEGLPPGEHGVHIHMVGTCEGPKFESAGAHWNPGDKQHGLDNSQGPHAGDMPNLIVGSDGRGTVTYRLKGGDIAGLLDADGSAMVVHAKTDDQKTDPSGDSGDRIACGAFTPG